MKHICDDCVNYFDYKSIYKPVDGEESKNKFSSCLVFGAEFQIQNHLGKNFTQSCSQFKKKRR